MGAIYFLNIVDAMIDAHFFIMMFPTTYLHIHPAFFNSPDLTAAVGFRINIGF